MVDAARTGSATGKLEIDRLRQQLPAQDAAAAVQTDAAGDDALSVADAARAIAADAPDAVRARLVDTAAIMNVAHHLDVNGDFMVGASEVGPLLAGAPELAPGEIDAIGLAAVDELRHCHDEFVEARDAVTAIQAEQEQAMARIRAVEGDEAAEAFGEEFHAEHDEAFERLAAAETALRETCERNVDVHATAYLGGDPLAPSPMVEAIGAAYADVAASANPAVAEDFLARLEDSPVAIDVGSRAALTDAIQLPLLQHELTAAMAAGRPFDEVVGELETRFADVAGAQEAIRSLRDMGAIMAADGGAADIAGRLQEAADDFADANPYLRQVALLGAVYALADAGMDAAAGDIVGGAAGVVDAIGNAGDMAMGAGMVQRAAAAGGTVAQGALVHGPAILGAAASLLAALDHANNQEYHQMAGQLVMAVGSAAMIACPPLGAVLIAAGAVYTAVADHLGPDHDQAATEAHHQMLLTQAQLDEPYDPTNPEHQAVYERAGLAVRTPVELTDALAAELGIGQPELRALIDQGLGDALLGDGAETTRQALAAAFGGDGPAAMAWIGSLEARYDDQAGAVLQAVADAAVAAELEGPGVAQALGDQTQSPWVHGLLHHLRHAANREPGDPLAEAVDEELAGFAERAAPGDPLAAGMIEAVLGAPEARAARADAAAAALAGQAATREAEAATLAAREERVRNAIRQRWPGETALQLSEDPAARGRELALLEGLFRDPQASAALPGDLDTIAFGDRNWYGNATEETGEGSAHRLVLERPDEGEDLAAAHGAVLAVMQGWGAG